MKNLKKIFKIVLLILLISCDEEADLLDQIDNSSGAFPNFEKSVTADAFINFEAIEVSESVTLEFSAEAIIGNVSAINIIGLYRDKLTEEEDSEVVVYKAVLFENQTPTLNEYTITTQDIIDKFTEINGFEDFSLGDVLTITAEIVNSSGQRITIFQDNGAANFSSNVINSVQDDGEPFNVSIDYPVSCPSNIGGTYLVESTSGATTDTSITPDKTPLVNFTSEVILTDIGGGIYSVSDAFFGVYMFWFDTQVIPSNITDICGNLSAEFKGPFDGDTVVEGTVNDDGTITIGWSNSFGDFANFTLTPQ